MHFTTTDQTGRRARHRRLDGHEGQDRAYYRSCRRFFDPDRRRYDPYPCLRRLGHGQGVDPLLCELRPAEVERQADF